MIIEEGGSAGSRTSTTTDTSRYSSGAAPRYSGVPGTSRKRRPAVRQAVATGAAAVLEAETARFEVYPNEIASFALSNALSINNDTETTVTWDTTTGRLAFEQGLARDIVGNQAISVDGTPSNMLFEVSGFIQWAAGATGYRQVAIDSQDGLAYAVIDCMMAVTTASILTVQSFRAVFARAETDTSYVLKVRHTQGTALNIAAGQFQLMRVH